MARRTAKEFSRKKIWEIARSYARTSCTYSHEYYEREYEISESTFYTLMEKAVVEHIVDMETVNQMAEKASYNSRVKAGEAGAERSRKHYEYLKQKRRLYHLPKKKAIDLTIKYAESKLNKKEFANRNYMTTQLMDTTIKDAIIQNWISDDVVEMLKRKSLRRNDSKKVLDFWINLETLRRKNKNQG